MKKIIILLVLISSPIFANHQYISLAPGSSATIFVGQETTVTCQGTGAPSFPRQHCKCVAQPNVHPIAYGIALEELGLITDPRAYSSIQYCNKEILSTFKEQCFY